MDKKKKKGSINAFVIVVLLLPVGFYHSLFHLVHLKDKYSTAVLLLLQIPSTQLTKSTLDLKPYSKQFRMA